MIGAMDKDEGLAQACLRLRGRRNVERSRAQLRSELAADAAGRLKRLAGVALLESWLADVWSLEPVDTGARSERG